MICILLTSGKTMINLLDLSSTQLQREMQNKAQFLALVERFLVPQPTGAVEGESWWWWGPSNDNNTTSGLMNQELNCTPTTEQNNKIRMFEVCRLFISHPLTKHVKHTHFYSIDQIIVGQLLNKDLCSQIWRLTKPLFCVHMVTSNIWGPYRAATITV